MQVGALLVTALTVTQSAGAYAGYQYNQYLGFELGYDWFGK